MSGYKEFPQDVRELFHTIIMTYNFTVEKQTSFVVRLSAEMCILNLT